MKIAIDVSQIVYKTGVSHYTEELVKHLLEIDRKNEYLLFASSLRQREVLKEYLNQLNNRREISKRIFPFPPSFLEILWNRLHFFSIENLIGGVNVFHSSDWLQPPCGAKKVTTVHDLSFLHFPESFPKRIIDNQKRRLFWVKKEVELIIADSKTTKEDLIKLLGIDEKKIRVIYLGVNSKCKISNSKLKLKIKNLKKKYNFGGNYLLYMGTLQPRKNLIRLIEAFNETMKQFNNLTMKLVIAGKKGWMYEEIFKKVKELGLEKDVVFTGFVSEEEKWALLKNALCFVYPSLYEGFGLPVLEAMQAGCSVITSNVSSLPEIVGKVAILVDPKNIEEIAKAMSRVCFDVSVRRSMREKGLMRVKKFTWKKTAEKTLAVYEELMKT